MSAWCFPPTPRSLIKSQLEMETGEGGLAAVVAGLSSSTGARAELVPLLEFVAEAAKADRYFSLELAARGGFQLLHKLQQATDGSDDEQLGELVQEAIGAVFGGCATFPRVPLESADAEYLRPLCYKFSSPVSGGEFGVVLRRVPRHVGAQDNVGFILWSAAVIQSRWLCRHAAEYLSATTTDVLEVGAGVGLSGIVASHFCRSVELTDFNEDCIKNLRANTLLNQGSESVLGLPAATRAGCTVRVAKLDWSLLAEAEAVAEAEAEQQQQPKVEMIIGSDIICCVEDVGGVCRVIEARLARTESARCFFVVASSDHRWGVEGFVPALRATGLEVDYRPLIGSSYKNKEFAGRDRHAGNRGGQWSSPSSPDELALDDELLAGIDEADYFTWQLILCRWPLRSED